MNKNDFTIIGIDGGATKAAGGIIQFVRKNLWPRNVGVEIFPFGQICVTGPVEAFTVLDGACGR